MLSYGQVAAKVRALKARRPDLFCGVRGCLWQVMDGEKFTPCRRHYGHTIPRPSIQEHFNDVANGRDGESSSVADAAVLDLHAAGN